MSNRSRTRFALPALMAVALAGCDDTGLGPTHTPEVTLSFAVTGGAPGAAGAMLASQAEGPLVLSRVELLLREVELKRVEHDHCDGDDACEKFVTGPVLVQLPLEGGVVTPFSGAIDPGTYDELELRIKEPEDDNGDRARFQAAHPEWPRKATVRVQGTFDAGAGPEPFDVFLEVDAELERELVPPLVVDAATDPASLNVTLSVRVLDWFRTAGGSPLDPRRIPDDEELADDVAERIEASLEAYRDDDRDGRDDEDDDEDDEEGSEFEGLVSAVDLDAGTVTLSAGTVLGIGEQAIDQDGDLTTLQAVADAVAAGRVVEAEGRAVRQAVAGQQVWVATEIKFEWDDD